jgi:hypothetical protein
MPAVAAIVLADALATPVNHTFSPLGPDANGVWWFEDPTTTSAIGNWRLSAQLTRPGPPASGDDSSKRVCRVKIGIHIPILENVTNSTISGISPAPTVAYVPRCMMEFILPERSVKDYDRKTLRKFAYNLLQNANIALLVEDLQNHY